MEGHGPFRSQLENGLLNKKLNVFTVTLSPDSPEQHGDEVGSVDQITLQCLGTQLLPQRGVERLGRDFVNNANILRGETTKQNKTRQWGYFS